MTNLEYELKKQIWYCCHMNNFRSGIYVSSREKVNIVVKELKDIIAGIGNFIERETFGVYDNYIAFKNSSILKIVVTSDQSRGRKFHGCVIDEDITGYVKNTIIYPTITQRMIFVEDYIYEPWENTKRRVVEVKIGEKNGRNH